MAARRTRASASAPKDTIVVDGVTYARVVAPESAPEKGAVGTAFVQARRERAAALVAAGTHILCPSCKRHVFNRARTTKRNGKVVCKSCYIA